MSNDMYSIEWEELPLKFRKYIPIILPLLQKPLYLSGYGIFQCNYVTFAQVHTILLSFFLLMM